MLKSQIKGVIFDLDNTLLDFMKMKEFAVKSAIKGMIEAGLLIDEEQSYSEIVGIYEEFGWENQQVFDVFIEKQIGHVDNKFLAQDSLEFRKYINTITPDVDMSYPFECKHCGHTQEVVVPLGTGFFWPNAS